MQIVLCALWPRDTYVHMNVGRHVGAHFPPFISAKGGWLPGAFGPMALVGFALGGTIDGRGGLVPRLAGVPTVGGHSSGLLAAIGHCRAAQTLGPSQAQALQLTHGRTIGRGISVNRPC